MYSKGEIMEVLNGLVSGLIGALLGAGVSFLTLRFNYRDLYSRSVSTNRMEWINNFREEIATIIAALECAKTPFTQNDDIIIDDIIYQAYKARAKLLTRLNMDTSKNGNEYNKVMADILVSIDFETDFPNNAQRVNALVELSRKILEPEWKRVKNEAGGK